MSSLQEVFGSAWGPVLIFGLRIVDMSLTTVRVLLSNRGEKVIAPILGFVANIIWVLALGGAVKFLSSPWHLLGYAGGFATGNFVGIWLEEKLAYGFASVRIVSRDQEVSVAETLRDLGFGATQFEGKGRQGAVELVYVVARRKEIKKVVAAAQKADPDAFITVDQPRSLIRGWVDAPQSK